MLPTPSRRRTASRMLVAFLSWTLVLGQTVQPVLAAPTPLADVPIASKVQAKPNIVYTVDDSGSMQFTYLPDFAVGKFCRGGNNVAACAEIRLANSSFYYPPILAADFNRLAYDPNINYTPPLKYDGTPYTTTAPTDALGNQPYTAAQDEPFLAPKPGTRRNLTAKVNVLLYCNTDWPLDTLFGNANGEYMAGTGAWCRINGTKYDLSAASGAPAVAEDYNYPYQPSVAGTTGTQYFYRQLTSKTIWCDTTSPKWPRATTGASCTTVCSAGVPTYTSQTCNAGAASKACCTAIGSPAGCAAASTYSPGSCNTSLLYCSPGLGSAPECIGGCACNTLPTGTNATCSITGASCGCTGAGCVPLNPNPAKCPDQITGCTAGGVRVTTCTGPIASAACNAKTWDPVALAYTTTTLLQDSDADGEVCRHNNLVYAVGGVAAAPFTYPRTRLSDVTAANQALGQQGKFITAATSGGCPTITNPVQIPRHYYTVDSVQFCSGVDGTANGQWKGFGVAPCGPKNDFGAFTNVKYGQFHRINLINDGRTFDYTDQVSGAPKTRTFAEESVNYANWYAYYRSRLLATKTTSSIAFSYLDDTYRVGFENLGTEPSPTYGVGAAIVWTDVDDWVLGVGNQRDKWYTSLFGLGCANCVTTTASAMLRIGNLFQTGGAGGLPPEVNPLPSAKDPITLSCQSNYHILFTDGRTQQVAKPAVVGNVDQTVPAWGATIVDIVPDNVMPVLRPAAGGPWMRPFAESGAPSVSDSLADIATHYWVTDLRPGMKNDVPAHSGLGGNDTDPTKDIAWWQHLSFNAISFGAEGVLDAADQTTTMSALTAGTKTWTPTLRGAAADPFYPNNPAGNPGASAVDDLWHAAVNSRGQYVYANSPLEVSYGLAKILLGIGNQRKARVGAAFGGQVLDAANNVIYEAAIEPGWAGDLIKVEIDPATGAEVTRPWQANFVLGQQLDPVFTGQVEPWFTNRRIVTINSSSGSAVPFLHANLSAAQKASLSPDATTQQKMVAYLRGGSSFAAKAIEGTKIGQFRQRPSAGKDPVDGHPYPAGLGDISNAQPVIVGPPKRPYVDTTDPGYSGFKAANAGRSTRIVAAANDGMVHSFDAATGKEVFAFVPKALFRGTAGSVATEDVTAIQALTYQDGGVPIYHHHFYVDSSPRSADVDFGGGDWHTIVVGGLGKGGNSYYALDLTDASAVDESAAAAKVMWEWSNGDVKYSYGRPVIVKVRDSGFPNGRWVVLVTSGYNNPSGVGKLFILDARTGALLSTISTGAGSGSEPSGFAQIHAFVKDQSNQIAEQIYGGDLLGNFWRIDVSAVDSYLGAPAVLFAQLTDSSGAPQPVTTAPQIEIDLNNGIDRYVFIGTGRLLDTSDLTTPSPPQQQTMYAIRDGTFSSVLTAGLPIQPRATMSPINADGVSAIVGGAPNGWYHDLPSTLPGAERIVVDVQADINIALYIGTQIQDDPCIISLPATIYARDYTSAKSLLLSGSGGAPVASINFGGGAVGSMIVGLVKSDGSQTLGALISKETIQSEPINIANPITGPGNRLSWRLLTGE